MSIVIKIKYAKIPHVIIIDKIIPKTILEFKSVNLCIENDVINVED
jgi:hypothetical protein